MLTPEADLDFIKAKFCFENLFKQLIKHPHLMRYRQTNSRLGYHRDTAWVQNLEQHFLRGETFVLVLAACLVGSFDSMCCGLIVAQNLAIWELSERARNLILCSKQTTCEVNCDYSLSFCSTLIYLHKHLYIVYTYMYIHTYMKPTLLPFSLHCLLHAVLHVIIMVHSESIFWRGTKIPLCLVCILFSCSEFERNFFLQQKGSFWFSWQCEDWCASMCSLLDFN